MDEQLIEMMTKVYKLMSSDDFADSVATMMRNIYDKLLSKGFSPEQAMEITLHFARSQTKST